MIIFLTIAQYLVAAVIDVFDKFLISKRKIEPVSYTFFTVVTGALLLVIWPWVYQDISSRSIILNLLSGAVFSLTMYVFFKVLSDGEVSRVIPFVFGLAPVFDIFLAWVTGRNLLNMTEFAALWLLIPGALMISYKPKEFSKRHVGEKLLSAALFSVYFAFWQYGAQEGPVLNSLMWNRLGAALVLVLLLVFPLFRRKVFTHKHIKNKKQTSVLFLAKQALGGANFIFFSYLLAVGKISVINSLQGFRYGFLLLAGIFLTRKFKQVLVEDTNSYIIKLKVAALVLIFLGTIILFL